MKENMSKSDGSSDEANNYEGLEETVNRKQCVWNQGKAISTGLIQV